MTEQFKHKGGIMVVDDNPANLKLLEEMLLQRGIEVRSFPRGRLALAAAERKPPDLILLDINMPEMNGLEVCERLKSNDQLRDIPVIFLSALTDTEDKVKAFRSGAVDYISKPFQFEEVHARVETHLHLHALQRELKLQNERLEQAVADRTRELAEANQRLTILDRSKSDFLNLISHEFRTPLNGLLGVGELLWEQMPSTQEIRELEEMYHRSRERILSILEDALLLAEIDVHGQQFGPALVPLGSLLDRAIQNTSEFAESRRVKLPVPNADPSLVLGDRELLERAFHTLLATAVKFSKTGQTVGLDLETSADLLRVSIEGHGKLIPAAALDKFFDVFSISESGTGGGDLGLGPAVAYRILALFGASVSVANLDSPGIRLTVSLKNAAQGA